MWWCSRARRLPAQGVSLARRRPGLGSSSLLFTLAVLVATGCGFHLRGATGGLTPGDVSVLGIDAGNPLAQALAARGAAQAPRYEVNIEREAWDRRVSAFGSDGRAVEYELKYDVAFTLRDIASGRTAPSDTVRVLRFYGFDPSQPLAKSAEESSIRADMVREAAASLLRRTASWGRAR